MPLASPLVLTPDATGHAEMQCPACGTRRRLNLEPYRAHRGTLRLRCRCGQETEIRAVFEDTTARAADSVPTAAAATAVSGSTTADVPSTAATPGADHAAGQNLPRFTVSASGVARPACPTCGVARELDARKYASRKGPLALTCQCGQRFRFILDFPGTKERVSTPAPKLQHCEVAPDGHVTLTCPSCGFKKDTTVPLDTDPGALFSINCPCGQSFSCRFFFAIPPLPAEPVIPDVEVPPIAPAAPAPTPSVPTQPVVSGQPLVFYLDANNQTQLTCPRCGFSKPVDVSLGTSAQTVFTIKCPCGGSYKARFATPAGVERSVERRPGEYFTLLPGEFKDQKVRVYHAYEDGKATLVCDTCGFTKFLNASEDKRLTQPTGFACTCGRHFPFCVEFRKDYRKEVALLGTWMNLSTGKQGKMIVKNLSLGGMGFLIQVGFDAATAHGVLPNHTVEVHFQLDDQHKTEIRRKVKVKSVRANLIGCQYLEKIPYDKELGFYIMP